MKSKSSLLGLILSACAFAVDAPLVEAHIKFISTTKPLLNIGILRDKNAERLVIPTDMFSEEIVYRGPARLELIELSATPVPKPKSSQNGEEQASEKQPRRGFKSRPPSHEFVPTGKPPIAWTNLPTNQGRLNLIMLITPGYDNGITVLQDTTGSFPPGSNRYLNLCPFTVVVKTPSGEQPIAPKESKVIRPGAKDRDYYDLQFLCRLDSGDKLNFSGRVFHMESARKLYLLLPGPGVDGRLVVRDIEDRQSSNTERAIGPTPPKQAK
jgi:hypothetical protein